MPDSELEAQARPDDNRRRRRRKPTPARGVLRAALQVEPDPVEVAIWYRRTRIAELENLTAAQLVALGRAGEVIGFLLAIRQGARD